MLNKMKVYVVTGILCGTNKNCSEDYDSKMPEVYGVMKKYSDAQNLFNEIIKKYLEKHNSDTIDKYDNENSVIITIFDEDEFFKLTIVEKELE